MNTAIPSKQNELNAESTPGVAAGELTEAELDQVSGGTYQKIQGPSGAVYYRNRTTGKVWVEDPKTESSHPA